MKRWVCLTAAIALGLGARGARAESCTAPSFGPRLSHTLGALPHAMAFGDFNRDGHTDLAVGRAWQVEVEVAILLGNGNGGFTPAGTLTFRGGGMLGAVVAADFDRDGKLDLAVAEGASGSIVIVRGTGTGAFTHPTYHVVGVGPRSLSVADLDRDGRADLVVAGQDGVYVLRGDGEGGFAPVETHPAGEYLRFVLTADLNRDGNTDVVTVSTDVPIIPAPPPSRLYVLLGNGAGGLGPPVPYDLGLEEWGVAAADLDRDGVLDLAATHGTGLAVLPGLGNGTFGPARNVYTGPIGRAVQAADVDASGTLDLVLSGHYEVHVLLGNGTFDFSPATSFAMGNSDAFLALAELNGDDRPDLVVEGETNVDVRLNAFGTSCPRPAFDPAYTTAALGDLPIWLTIGELNRDGRPDLVATQALPPRVTLLHGNGTGGFVTAATLTAGSYPTGAAIADFNRDGLPDLAVSTEISNDITLFLRTSGGTYQASTHFAGGESYGILAEDFNRDGRTDLVVTDVLEDELRVLLGNGQGGFGAPQTLSVVPGPWRAYPAELNGDGRADLAVVNDTDLVTLLFGDGDGGFPVRATLSVPGLPRSIAMADWNGDGRLDLAVQAIDGPVRVFFGDGAGAFPDSVTVPAGSSARGVVALDFNGDGHPDLAVAQGTGTVPVLLIIGHGDGTFGAAEPVGSSGSAARLVAGHFDGDGRIDLALLDYAQDRVVAFRNARCTPRLLALVTDVLGCNLPGVPFARQPAVEVQDEGGNRVRCAQGTVTASLEPSSPPGATLSGTRMVPVQQGLANYTDLSIDLPASSYRLGFDLGGFHVAGGVFDQELDVDIEGPARICPGASATYSSPEGYDSYLWDLDGTTISNVRTAVVNGLAAGPHTLRLRVARDTCTAEDVYPVAAAGPQAVVSGDRAMCSVSAVTIRADLEGTPPWSLTWSDGFTQTGIAATPHWRTVRPAATASYTLTALSDAACAGTSSGSATVTVDPTCAARYFVVPPCRLLDTRNPPGPSGGPALDANTSRAFAVAGHCGIPATAKAVAVNLTAVNPGELGNLRLFPTGTPVPSASAVNFGAGRTRASNAVVALGADGQLTVQCDMAPGSASSTHLMLDVYGFLE